MSADSGSSLTHHAQAILGVVIAFTVVSTICIVLRMLAKKLRGVRFCFEDGLIAAAQLSLYGLAAVSLLGVILVDAGDRPLEVSQQPPQALKLFLAFQVLYNVSIALVRPSVCLLFNRIFPSRTLHTFSFVLIAISCSWFVGSILFEFLACRPLAGFWNAEIRGHACVKDRTIPYMILGIADIIVDMAILTVAAFGVWGLEVATRDVLGMGLVFSPGLCAIVMKTLRTIALVQASTSHKSSIESYVAIWSFVAVALCLAIVCVPFFSLISRSASRGVSHLTSDMELQMSPLHVRRFAEFNVDGEQSADNWSLEVRKGKGKRGSYIVTQMLESGHWNPTLQTNPVDYAGSTRSFTSSSPTL